MARRKTDKMTVRILKFLSRVRGIDVDDIDAIAAISPPPFLCWAEQLPIFESTLDPKQLPADRCLLVLGWFLLSLKRQYCPSDGPELPNDYLDERCIVTYFDGSTATHAVTEQVPLDPSTTAAYIWNETHGIRCSANLTVPTVFGNGLAWGKHGFKICQSGHAILINDRWDEHCLIPVPRARLRGFWSRRWNLELIGTCHIVSSSGIVIEIEFLPWSHCAAYRPRHSFRARIWDKVKGNKRIIYLASGQWNGKYTVTDFRGGTTPIKKKVDLSMAKPPPRAQDRWSEKFELWEQTHWDPVENPTPWEKAETLVETSSPEDDRLEIQDTDVKGNIRRKPAFFTEHSDLDSWESEVFNQVADKAPLSLDVNMDGLREEWCAENENPDLDMHISLVMDRMRRWWSAEEAKIKEMMSWSRRQSMTSET